MAPAGSLTSLDAPFLPPLPAADTPPATVRESYGGVLTLGSLIGGSGWDLFAGDPAARDRFGAFFPADRVQLPNHAPSGFYTEPQLRAVVAWSRYLCERNMLALGFRDRVRDFVGPVTVQWVRRGSEPGAVTLGTDRDGDGGADADRLVKRVQQEWDDWCEANDWGRGEEDRERECRERAVEDGEVILRLGARGRHAPGWCRFVEPEQVRPPAGRLSDLVYRDADWRWGVATHPRDAETVLAYWVCDPDSGGADGEEVTPDQIVRAKFNVKRTHKRGLPDFFPVEQHLWDALGIIANVGSTSGEQSSVAWIQRYAVARGDEVRNLLTQAPEAYGPHGKPVRHDHEGRAFPGRAYGKTRVIHADNNRQYDPGPVSTGVPVFNEAVDMTLKGVGFRFGIPDWFATGSGDSFAAVLVTGSPFVRTIEDRQARQIGFVTALANRVVRLAEESGRLPAGTSERVKPVCTAKPVVIADEEKQARTHIALYEKDLADPTEIIKKRGSDPKVVAANIKAWRQQFPKDDGRQPGGDGGGNPPGPNDPTPAPPGSAGGDGSSPGDDPFAGFLGESRVAEAGFTGTVRDRRGREFHYQDGKRVAAAPAGGDSGGFGGLGRGPEQPARDAVVNHTRAAAQVYRAVRDGRVTPEQAKTVAAHDARKASAKLKAGFDRRLGALRADVAAVYGTPALHSPEWAAVEAHARQTRDKLLGLIEDTADDVAKAADRHAAAGKLPADAAENLGYVRAAARREAAAFMPELARLVAAFKAAVRPAAESVAREHAAQPPFPGGVWDDTIKHWVKPQQKGSGTKKPAAKTNTPGGKGDPAAADYFAPHAAAKPSPGSTVAAPEHAAADAVSNHLARALGGRTEEETEDAGQKDKKPYDVQVPKAGGGGYNDVEVKSLLKGDRQGISVHEDALLRKVRHAQAHPDNTFHVVVSDERDRYGGGSFAGSFSGHRLYYRRGAGKYTLAQMYPVADGAELKRLLDTPDDQLPEKARGHLPPPPDPAELERKASAAAEGRKARDKARKERNRDKLREQARLRAEKAKAAKLAAQG